MVTAMSWHGCTLWWPGYKINLVLISNQNEDWLKIVPSVADGKSVLSRKNCKLSCTCHTSPMKSLQRRARNMKMARHMLLGWICCHCRLGCLRVHLTVEKVLEIFLLREAAGLPKTCPSHHSLWWITWSAGKYMFKSALLSKNSTQRAYGFQISFCKMTAGYN